MLEEDLMKFAVEARKQAHAPFSQFRVGAALRAESGKIYTGCNIENASYSATVCAERVAFFKAVSEGERFFTSIAIAGGRGEFPTGYCTPCGVCRQVMSEFCDGTFRIILGSVSHFRIYRLDELFALPFSSRDIR